MSDEGAGLTGVEVEPEPHSHQQGKKLTCHKVNLHTGTHRYTVTEEAKETDELEPSLVMGLE